MDALCFERFFEIEGYLDLPMQGEADFRSIRHRFCQVGWSSPPKQQREAWDRWASDTLSAITDNWGLYRLVPVDGDPEPILARATFQGMPSGEVPPTDLEAVSVSWHPLSVQERVDRISNGQRGTGPEGMLGTPNLVVSF